MSETKKIYAQQRQRDDEDSAMLASIVVVGCLVVGVGILIGSTITWLVMR